jgi:hypothetical protein
MLMEKQDILSILITFVVGIFAGVYLYVSVFATIVDKVVVPDEARISDFSIVGDTYGGCRNRCASFQVLSDASFKYLYTPTTGGEQKILEGNLSLSLQNRIDRALVVSELERQSASVEKIDCSSAADGIDVVYEITVKGEKYLIDSCGTAADGDSELWKVLAEIWQSFGNQ